MSKYEGQERRRVERMKLVTFCPVHFAYGGNNHEAMMINVSKLGAGFRIDSVCDQLRLNKDDKLELTIRTPYGPSEAKGRVVWFRIDEENCTWGLEFTEVSQDEKDPLICLMDSSF